MSWPAVDEVDAWLSAREADVANLRPAARKRVHWAGSPGVQTPLSVVFVHGFSACCEEIRPVTDNIAKALGANLHYTRLAGHGRDGAAMAEPSFEDWLASTHEALQIGRIIGREVVVISCSTGGPLVCLEMAANGVDGLAAQLFVSPNFDIQNFAGRMAMRVPGFQWWGPKILGWERSFTPHNPGHAAHWTTTYPLLSLMPMRVCLAKFRALDLGRFRMPALTVYSEDDKVVSPAAAKRAAWGWGGPASLHPVTVGEGDDVNAHVIAGDILSPGQTAPVTSAALRWLKEAGFDVQA
ncbi:MAG: alpha/beta hydrolase [Pseudomonadota bacterium]